MQNIARREMDHSIAAKLLQSAVDMHGAHSQCIGQNILRQRKRQCLSVKEAHIFQPLGEFRIKRAMRSVAFMLPSLNTC